MLSLEGKIMSVMGGVGGRIALSCLGWARGAMQILSGKAKRTPGRGNVLSLSFGQWGIIKGFKLRNDNLSERLIQPVHEEWVGGEGNCKYKGLFVCV